MNEEIEHILARYFSGEATEKELHALDIWLSESDENEKQFHQFSLLYQYVGQIGETPAIDTDRALTQFKNYIHEKQHNNRKSSFNISNIWRMAAAIAILVIGTFTVFYFVNPSSNTVQFIVAETSKNITLFENMEVTLFPGTEIIHHKQSKNEVQLKGKATFNIDSETASGIIVQAGETFIKDIGTVFTVNATMPDISISVEVTEGEVWFYTETNSGVYVNAGESAVYDVLTKQFMMIEIVETLRATSLREIIFQNTPFHDAIDLIKTRYGVDIVISTNELNEVLLNASFDNNEPVEYVLEIITATISAQLSKKNNTYIITPQH
jgi:ferric-dicitrate binding protein FerR (iron transport regulator)